MKEKKQIALVSVFVGIIWMVYLIVAYLQSKEHNSSFFMCMGFVSVSALIKWRSHIHVIRKLQNEKGFFFYQSVITAGNIYFFAEMVVAAILIWFQVQLKRCFIIQFILLAAGVITIIASMVQCRELERRDRNRCQITGEVRALENYIKSLCEKAKDKELKKMLVNLSEETRFSEPFYGNGAETFNKEIEIQMKALEEAISIEETKTAKELVMQIKEVLKNRNNSIKMLRRKGNQ